MRRDEVSRVKGGLYAKHDLGTTNRIALLGCGQEVFLDSLGLVGCYGEREGKNDIFPGRLPWSARTLHCRPPSLGVVEGTGLALGGIVRSQPHGARRPRCGPFVSEYCPIRRTLSRYKHRRMRDINQTRCQFGGGLPRVDGEPSSISPLQSLSMSSQVSGLGS